MKIDQCIITAERKVELQKKEIPDREPHENEILIESLYTLVSPGTETAIYSGLDPDCHRPGGWCNYPFEAGSICAGRVLKAGKNRWGYKSGDLLLTGTPHASHAWIDTSKDLTAHVPPGMDLKEATYSKLIEVSLTAVHVSSVKKGESVAVIGLGPVGNFAAQLFKEYGARVVGLDPSLHRRELAKKMGVPKVLNSGTLEENQEAIRDSFGGDDPRIVVEAVGEPVLIMQALDYVRHGQGEVILLGAPRRELVMNVTSAFEKVMDKGTRLLGAHAYSFPMFPTPGRSHCMMDILNQAVSWLKEGKVVAKPLISHTLRPEKLQEAYEGLLNLREEYTGVVLDWTNR